MNAKQRYRRRIALQSAMSRVLSLLGRNIKDEIPPDRTTGELAAQLVVWLTIFAGKAGVKLPKPWEGDAADLARFEVLTKARMKETIARRNRRRKQMQDKTGEIT